MRALTLIDDNKDNPTPWASLMETGVKTIETRKWPVPYANNPMPFDLLICASASSRTANRSKAVCIVEVYECMIFSTEDEQKACCDLYPGFGWHTRKLRWLSDKFFVKGQMGIFQVDIPEYVTIYTPTSEQIQSARLALTKAYNVL